MSQVGPAGSAEARSLVADLVGIPSPSGAEGRIAAHVERVLGDWGIDTRRVPSETGRDNLVVGAEDPALVIVAHLDTIDPPWPADAVVEGDTVHGLGAVDDKGGVAACMLAAAELHRRGLDLGEVGVAFAFSVDEERTGSGSRMLALELRPRFALALEATGLNAATAEIGGIEGMVHVSGRSAHGARPDLGENAIQRATALIASIQRLTDASAEANPLLGRPSAKIGSIEAGTSFNTVPDRCSFNLNLDLVPGQDAAARLSELEALIADHDGHLELIELTEPIESPANSPLVSRLDEACEAVLGERPDRIGVPAWTDAHNFHDFAGADTVVFGPGDFDCAHTPEERIDAASVVRCAEVFVELASRPWREAR